MGENGGTGGIAAVVKLGARLRGGGGTLEEF